MKEEENKLNNEEITITNKQIQALNDRYLQLKGVKITVKEKDTKPMVYLEEKQKLQTEIFELRNEIRKIKKFYEGKKDSHLLVCI